MGNKDNQNIHPYNNLTFYGKNKIKQFTVMPKCISDFDRLS
jgi:hypothetical protein